MGIQQQYYANSPFLLNNTSGTNLSKYNYDSVWNNPNELDLLEMKSSSTLPTIENQSSFIQVLPCIRRLYTIFDSICPNIYHIHCSDSLRILNEILCLTNEYLHVSPPSTISINELLLNEKYMDNFITQLRRPSVIRKKSYPSSSSSSIKTTELNCFGQGIHAYNNNNELNQTILFCFELTTITNNVLLPIDVLILDPDEKLVLVDLKYINTYNEGYTKLYSCSYTPITKAGLYKISFIYNNNKIPDSQYTVSIRNSTSNYYSYKKNEQLLPEKLMKKTYQEIPQYELEGEGCSTKIVVNSIARFRLKIKSSIISYHNSIINSFSLSILDPYDNTIVVQHRILSSDLLELTYQPMSIGKHKLLILFNNKLHQQIIIDVIHDESYCLSKLKPFGPGLKHAIVGLPTEFYIDLNQTINTNIHFRLEASYQAEIDYEQQMATVRYTPLKEGNFPIHILENDKDISCSPFIAHIEKNSTLRDKPCIRVIGLSKQIILHRPVEFQVFIDNSFDDSSNLLHIDILTDDNKSPSISIRRRHRSSYLCSFIPITLGKYLISIDYAGIVADNNPFYCQSIQEKDILLTGPAINNQCLKLNKPTHFCFALKDFLTNINEKNSTYESGYSSNDDISSKSSLSSSSNDIRTLINNDETNYRVTITDGHGNIKPDVFIKDMYETNNENNIRVDFTPDEQILYINISCTW